MDTSKMTMHYSSLEITILSAENLRSGNKHINTTNVSVVIRGGSGDDECTTKMATRNGDGLLTWNEKVDIKLPENADFISIEVVCTEKKGKLIGASRVPVTDFLGGFAPTNHLQFLSYRLRDSDGEPNGIINFSVRVIKGLPHRCSGVQPEMGIPVGGARRFGTVVTGVPAAWYRHPQV